MWIFCAILSSRPGGTGKGTNSLLNVTVFKCSSRSSFTAALDSITWIVVEVKFYWIIWIASSQGNSIYGSFGIVNRSRRGICSCNTFVIRLSSTDKYLAGSLETVTENNISRNDRFSCLVASLKDLNFLSVVSVLVCISKFGKTTWNEDIGRNEFIGADVVTSR